MNVYIIPLDQNYYDKAVQIAVESKTGLEKEIRSRMKHCTQYFVALKDKETVGVIGWYQDDGSFAGKSLEDDFPYGKDIYWISHFAVIPQLRNYGIGGKLIAHLEGIVKKRDGSQLWVYTSQARRFYEKHGFTFVRRAWIENHWEDVLKKKLDKLLEQET